MHFSVVKSRVPRVTYLYTKYSSLYNMLGVYFCTKYYIHFTIFIIKYKGIFLRHATSVKCTKDFSPKNRDFLNVECGQNTVPREKT